MTNKELKSIDLVSFTIMGTGINVLFSILISIIMLIGFSVMIPNSFSIMIYLVPTIVFGTLITCIFAYFSEGYLYNILSKKLKSITIDIDENGRINRISTTSTALMVSLISLIIVIIVYLAMFFITPLLLSTIIQILMMSGQMAVASILYQGLILINNPVTIGILLIIIFVITFVTTLVATFIYNILGNSNRGATVELSEDDKFTVIDSINPLNLAIVIAAISLVINIVIAIISIITGTNPVNGVLSIVPGLVSSFITGFLIALFYNFLAPKLGKLKVELINA